MGLSKINSVEQRHDGSKFNPRRFIQYYYDHPVRENRGLYGDGYGFIL
jgi:hypothetical protein